MVEEDEHECEIYVILSSPKRLEEEKNLINLEKMNN